MKGFDWKEKIYISLIMCGIAVACYLSYVITKIIGDWLTHIN